jgi:hypothetical protein
MQERILSTRVVHFTTAQVYWQCREQEACETFPDCLPPWAAPLTAFWSRWTNSTALSRKIESFHDEHKMLFTSESELYNAWYQTVEAYSICESTKDEDIFVAIAGIAAAFQKVTGDQWVAGIWKSRAIEGLQWFVDWGHPKLLGLVNAGERLPTVRPQSWRAPSWSWASVKHPIHIEKPQTSQQSTILVDIVDLDTKTMSTSAMLAGHIRLKGPLYTAQIQEYSRLKIDGRSIEDFAWLFPSPKLKMRTKVFFDEVQDPPYGTVVHLLPLLCSHTAETIYSKGLILEPIFFKGIFKRCGFFIVSDTQRIDEMLQDEPLHWPLWYESCDGSNGYTICIV